MQITACRAIFCRFPMPAIRKQHGGILRHRAKPQKRGAKSTHKVAKNNAESHGSVCEVPQVLQASKKPGRPRQTRRPAESLRRAFITSITHMTRMVLRRITGARADPANGPARSPCRRSPWIRTAAGTRDGRSWPHAPGQTPDAACSRRPRRGPCSGSRG